MNKKILVLAEHDNVNIKSSTAHTIQAARQLSGKITVLVAGYQCETVAKGAACLEGVDHVLLADALQYRDGLAENIANLMSEIGKEFQYIVASATTYGKNILPRLAAGLDVAQISDVIRIVSEDTFVRPIYAGNALCTVQSFDPIKIMTIRITAFDPTPNKTGANIAAIENMLAKPDLHLSLFIGEQTSVSARPELSNARIVISGGRGLQNKENFKILEEIADILGAAVGASRAAVDAGFVSNDYQIGQTGKVIAPDLYIAIGISGAIQHLAGMKDSKVIVAINKDADAPIFQVADYGMVGDLFQILPELTRELTIRKEKSEVK